MGKKGETPQPSETRIVDGELITFRVVELDPAGPEVMARSMGRWVLPGVLKDNRALLVARRGLRSRGAHIGSHPERTTPYDKDIHR